MAEAKSKLTGKNICMSNFGEAVAALEKFLFFKKLPDMSPSKGKKKHFKSFIFRKLKVKMLSNLKNAILVQARACAVWKHLWESKL